MRLYPQFYFLFLSLLLTLSQSCFAEKRQSLTQGAVTLQWEMVENTELGIEGQPLVTLLVSILGDKETQIVAPLPKEGIYQPLILVKAKLLEFIEKAGRKEATFEYQFLAPKAGEYEFREWTLHIVHQGKALPFLVPPQSIQIPASKAEQATITLEGPLPPNYRLWPFLLSLAFAGLLWKLLPLLGKKAKTGIQRKAKTPYEVALEKLQVLKDAKLVEQGKMEPFYRELSLILREFLEFYMQMHALESTTEEFVRSLRSRKDLPADEKKLLDQFLSLSDLVKFAQFAPDPALSFATIQEIETFIQGHGHAGE